MRKILCSFQEGTVARHRITELGAELVWLEGGRVMPERGAEQEWLNSRQAAS